MEGGDASDTATRSPRRPATVTVEVDEGGRSRATRRSTSPSPSTADEICLGDEAVITITNDSDTDVTITGLLTLPGGATMPVLYQVDAESTATHTDTPVLEGTHTIEWYAYADGYDATSGTLTFEVADCDGDEGPVEGDQALDLTITVAADEICLGDEAVITITNDSDTDVTITGLLTLPGGATMPVLYQVDAESTSTHTDTPVLEGTHTIEWYAFADGYDATSGTLTFVVEDCDEETPEPTEPPVVVPDIEVGDEDDVVEIDVEALYAQVCIGADVLITLTSEGADGDSHRHLHRWRPPLLDGLDLTDITLGDDDAFTFLLEDLAEGDYTLPFTVTDGEDFSFSDAFVIEVVDCDTTATAPAPRHANGDEATTPTSPSTGTSYRPGPTTPVVCPDGAPFVVVTATGTTSDVTEGRAVGRPRRGHRRVLLHPDHAR